MKTAQFRGAFVCLFALMSCVPAFALGVVVKVTPAWTTDGANRMNVRATRRDDGTVCFTVTRYLDNARLAGTETAPAEAIQRVGYLEVRDGKTLIVSTDVEGESKPGAVVYSFSVAPTSIASTRFSLWEAPIPARFSTEYDFELSEFAGRFIPEDKP